MGLISWIKGLFATPEVIDPPAKANTIYLEPGYATSNTVLTVTASVPATKPKKTKKPKAPKKVKAPKAPKKTKAEIEADRILSEQLMGEIVEKPKKARKPRAKKAPVDVIEEVTIEEIGENYANATKIESDDETKSTKKDE